jgi:hypothetical protein
MRKQFSTALVVGAGITLSAPIAASAKPASFDGTWSVRLVTETGACDSSYSQTIAIEDGRVQPLAVPGGPSTSVSGGVGGDGNVALAIRRSIATADAHGRLNATSGFGTWKLAALGCSGRWTAQRRSA